MGGPTSVSVLVSGMASTSHRQQIASCGSQIPFLFFLLGTAQHRVCSLSASTASPREHAPPSTLFGPSAPPAGTTRPSTILCMRLTLPLFFLLSPSSFYPVTMRRSFEPAVKFRAGVSTVPPPFRVHPSARVSVFYRGGGGDHPT